MRFKLLIRKDFQHSYGDAAIRARDWGKAAAEIDSIGSAPLAQIS